MESPHTHNSRSPKIYLLRKKRSRVYTEVKIWNKKYNTEVFVGMHACSQHCKIKHKKDEEEEEGKKEREMDDDLVEVSWLDSIMMSHLHSWGTSFFFFLQFFYTFDECKFSYFYALEISWLKGFLCGGLSL